MSKKESFPVIERKEPTMTGKIRLHFKQKPNLGKNQVDPKPKDVSVAEADMFEVGEKYNPKKYSDSLKEKATKEKEAKEKATQEADKAYQEKLEAETKQVEKIKAEQFKELNATSDDNKSDDKGKS